MPSNRAPYCAYCKEGIAPDKRLYSCAECRRYYHPGCYGRTLPGKPLGSPNWTCRSCLDKRTKRGVSANYMRRPWLGDHDSKSTSSYGETAKSSTSARTERRTTEMSSRTSGSFTPRTNDSGPPTTKCSVVGCSAKASGPQGNVCQVHAREVGAERAQSKASSAHQVETALPMVRRKTGSSGGVVRPEHIFSKANGSATPAQKRTQEARSPPEHPGGSGPARKRPRLEDDPAAAADSAGKPEATFKKPWHTNFNPRRSTKPSEQTLPRSDKDLEMEGMGKSKSPIHRIQRKSAPRIEFSSGPQIVTGNDQGSPPVSESPQANGNAARATSRAASSPSSQGKEFAGNDPLRAWYQRRESAKPDQHGDATTVDHKKDAFLRTRPSLEPAASASPSSSFIGADHRTVSSSFVTSPPKATAGQVFRPRPVSHSSMPPLAKTCSIPDEHREGWKFVPKPPPPPARNASNLDFDSLIYGQSGAAPPPPTVSVRGVQKAPPAPKAEPRDEPFFMHMDPRLHWPQPQTEEWRQKKLLEIEARGGRKANFGKAVQRMKEQRLTEPPKTFEETLPQKIRDDPAWVRALEKIRADELAQLQDQPPSKRGGYRGGQPKTGRWGGRRQPMKAAPTTPRKSLVTPGHGLR